LFDTEWRKGNCAEYWRRLPDSIVLLTTRAARFYYGMKEMNL
jgi:hypothetical protein